MTSANWPVPEKVLTIYAPLLHLFHESLDVAIPNAKQYFDVRNKPVDPSLFPNLVRYEVKELLEAAGQHAEEEEPAFERADVPNNGLKVEVNGDIFRILKSDQGAVPIAKSQARRDFYNFNQEQLAFDHADLHGYHYVVIWDVDSNFNLAGLRLAFPWLAAANVSVMRWIVGVPHPASMITPEPEMASEPTEDLPIELAQQPKKKKDTGTEGSA